MTNRACTPVFSFVAATVSSFILFVYFIGSDANFQAWEFELTFHGIKQPVTWAFPILFSLGFGIIAVICNWLMALFHRYRDVEGLLLLEGVLLAKAPLILVSVAAFIIFRPPNYSLSIAVVAVALCAAAECIFHVLAAARRVQRGLSTWKGETSSAAFLLNASLTAGGILVGLVLFETALRIHNPFTLRIKGDKIVLQTNYKFIINNDTPGKLEKTISVSWNSLGFRGDDPPVDFDKHLSIVVVGGSTAEDSSLSDDKTWISVMNHTLSDSQTDLWVNNAGLMGHSTHGHRLLVDDYLAKLRPDVIIFLIGINDLGKDGLGREGRQINALERSVHRENNNVRQFFDRLADYSEVANLINNIYRRYQASKAGLAPFNLRLKGEISRSKLIEPKPGEADTILERMPGVLDNYAERVRNLIRKSRAIGAKVVLVTQPLLIGPGVDPDLGFRLDNIEQQLLERPVSSLTYWNVLERYNDVVRAVGEELDVPVIDLAQQLEKRSSYYIDTMHFSVEGAAQVGKLVAAGLCPWLSKTFPEHKTTNECPGTR